jgi:Ku protein
MAYRPTWQGHLKLSLVTCPVALFTATNSGGDVHFNLINPKTNNRIKMITTDPDTGPIERSELVKGYEVSKGEYILLTNEEINDVKLESTKTIDIERFVAGDEIDRLYWDNPYFLAPDGKLAQEAFGVIRTAMEKSGQIALARVVIGTRAHPGAGAARQGHLGLHHPHRCGGAQARRGVRRHQRQGGRPVNDRHRREDHRAAGRAFRSQPVRGSL